MLMRSALVLSRYSRPERPAGVLRHHRVRQPRDPGLLLRLQEGVRGAHPTLTTALLHRGTDVSPLWSPVRLTETQCSFTNHRPHYNTLPNHNTGDRWMSVTEVLHNVTLVAKGLKGCGSYLLSPLHMLSVHGGYVLTWLNASLSHQRRRGF